MFYSHLFSPVGHLEVVNIFGWDVVGSVRVGDHTCA